MSDDATPSEDLEANLRAAQALVNTIEVQRQREDAAYRRGWEECGHACADLYTEAWEAGYWAHEADRQAEWEQFSGQIRARAGGLTFEERRAAEVAASGPRPGDFMGAEADPGYIDRCRISMGLPSSAIQKRGRPTTTLAGLLRTVLQADGPDRSRRLRWAADKTFEHASRGLFETQAAARALLETATAAGIDEQAARSLITSAYLSTTKDTTS